MTKKIFIIIALIALLGIGSAYGTYAWFSSASTSSGNVFETGELIIGASNIGDNLGFIRTNNLVPGGTAEGNVNVRNLGDIAFKYKVSAILSSGDTTLYNKLNVTISNDTTQLYSGALSGLDVPIGTLAPTASQNLKVVVSLPIEVGNDCQGKASVVQFAFNATQTGA